MPPRVILYHGATEHKSAVYCAVLTPVEERYSGGRLRSSPIYVRPQSPDVSTFIHKHVCISKAKCIYKHRVVDQQLPHVGQKRVPTNLTRERYHTKHHSRESRQPATYCGIRFHPSSLPRLEYCTQRLRPRHQTRPFTGFLGCAAGRARPTDINTSGEREPCVRSPSESPGRTFSDLLAIRAVRKVTKMLLSWHPYFDIGSAH